MQPTHARGNRVKLEESSKIQPNITNLVNTLSPEISKAQSSKDPISKIPGDDNLQTQEPSKKNFDVKMNHCDCQRNLKEVQENPTNLNFNQTTCSYDAFLRGPHQKVISFSFYGDINSDRSKMKGYFEGIVGNLKLIPKFYPGWIMRLYYDLDKNDPILKDICTLACSDNNLDICEVKHLPGNPVIDATDIFAMDWRFFPTLDPQV